MKKLPSISILLLLLLPHLFLGLAWNELPSSVPLHFGYNGKPDRYGSRESLWAIIAIVTLASALTYLLLLNIHRADPKRAAEGNRNRMRKIGFATLVFLTFVQLWMVQTVRQAEPELSARFLFVAIGLLFTILGNYMSNLKPNLFAGMRLPWTLHSETNWRKTHFLAARLWFGGGLLIAACSLLLPDTLALITLLVITFFLVLIPTAYSYRLFRKENGLTS